MTITPDVHRQFFVSSSNGRREIIRLPPVPTIIPNRPNRRQGRPWTPDEHDRFLQGLERYPHGPWSVIAAHVGTRTTRQTMTHAQKYRQRIARYSELGIEVSRTRNAAPTTPVGPLEHLPAMSITHHQDVTSPINDEPDSEQVPDLRQQHSPKMQADHTPVYEQYPLQRLMMPPSHSSGASPSHGVDVPHQAMPMALQDFIDPNLQATLHGTEFHGMSRIV